MTGKKYLVLKGRTWWFCRDIPAAIRGAFDGRKTFLQNLKTSDLGIAQKRRETALAESAKAFRRAGSGEVVEADPVTEYALVWQDDRRRWQADPAAWARTVSPATTANDDEEEEEDEDAVSFQYAAVETVHALPAAAWGG